MIWNLDKYDTRPHIRGWLGRGSARYLVSKYQLGPARYPTKKNQNPPPECTSDIERRTQMVLFKEPLPPPLPLRKAEKG